MSKSVVCLDIAPVFPAIESAFASGFLPIFQSELPPALHNCGIGHRDTQTSQPCGAQFIGMQSSPSQPRLPGYRTPFLGCEARSAREAPFAGVLCELWVAWFGGMAVTAPRLDIGCHVTATWD